MSCDGRAEAVVHDRAVAAVDGRAVTMADGRAVTVEMVGQWLWWMVGHPLLTSSCAQSGGHTNWRPHLTIISAWGWDRGEEGGGSRVSKGR